MAIPNAKTATEAMTETMTETMTQLVTDLPALAQKSREQLVSNLQQGQQLSIDAAKSWVAAVSALPVLDLPKVSGIPAAPELEAAAMYPFDLAADLLKAQREFALQLANTLVPATTS